MKHRRSSWLAGVAAAAALAYGAALYVIPGSVIAGLRVPVEGTPADHGVATCERVEFPSPDGGRLVAWWMPAPQARAAVILVHGGGDNRNDRYLDILGIARRVLDLGYAALAIDMRGHGESSDYPAGPVEIGPSNASDVSAAVDWLLARDPELAVGALGASMGGATVIYAAARDPRIAGAVVVDPITSVTFARALHERHPKMGYWETPPAPGDAPVLAESGRWSSHTRAFWLFPEAFMARVAPFLASRLSARAGGM